jgi:hypothetical protein
MVWISAPPKKKPPPLSDGSDDSCHGRFRKSTRFAVGVVRGPWRAPHPNVSQRHTQTSDSRSHNPDIRTGRLKVVICNLEEFFSLGVGSHGWDMGGIKACNKKREEPQRRSFTYFQVLVLSSPPSSLRSPSLNHLSHIS